MYFTSTVALVRQRRVFCEILLNIDLVFGDVVV